ncbi:unnamed protein product, partial [Closterium sp. NIES-54]
MSFPAGFAKLPPFGTAEAAASAAAAAAAGTKRRAEDALEGSAGSGGAGGGGSISGGSSAGASRRKIESSGPSPPQLPPPKTAPSALQGRPPTPPTAASAAAAALVALAPPPAVAAQRQAAAQQQQQQRQQQQAAGGLHVRALWLTVSPTERYLLLEDQETGDVLMPLIHMRKMFEANYSRKLSSLKHRLVTISPDLAASAAAASALPSPPALLQGFLYWRWAFESPHEGFLYWRWAFESPHEVKVLVRKMLGEENTPQGHLRLILVPIVYNAMALKENLRKVNLTTLNLLATSFCPSQPRSTTRNAILVPIVYNAMALKENLRK